MNDIILRYNISNIKYNIIPTLMKIKYSAIDSNDNGGKTDMWY